MPRRREVPKRKWLPDPKYRNVLLTRFMNVVMQHGKKAVAEKIVYGALSLIEEEGMDAIDVFTKALENVKPQFEVKSRRVGGATYQVPVEVREERRIALALRWIVLYSSKRSGGSTMREKMAAELKDAYHRRGQAVKKREDTHKMADANKAFAHYRW